MLKLKFILPAMLMVLAGCSQKIRNVKDGHSSKQTNDSLYVTLAIKNVVKYGEKVNLRFVVHNGNARGKSFCKWHTPFEPIMSKYLDIKDENGNEAPYKGPMAKRIMPPPAESYLFVNPTDSITADIDLSKGYELAAGKTYTATYNSSNISGLKTSNMVRFTL